MRTAAEQSVILSDEAGWYKDAVLYEVHVRAFRDSDADGIGDFRGLVEKLDYIKDLGVTALWILPFYPSPMRDDGYDISDYERVNPAYGTLRDFRVLLREAHARGMRVITELVLAHTSDEHPWFRRARHARPGTPARDFYVWSDTADRYREARVIFTDFETSNWAFDPVADAYFWHRFYSHQPSLNYDNPAVRQAMFDVVDFWFEMGVDGMRLDAVPYLFARDGTTCENLPETFAFVRELRAHVDANFSNRMLLAEANQWPEDAVAYLGDGDACHMAFHFPLMPRMFMAARQEDRFPIVDILNETPPIPPNCQWALFLRNHDELTLEMVTDEERDYMYRVYADDPQARINVGIRRRLAPLLGNDRKLIEMMNGLLFSLPGTPIVYYGDEIGMGDNIYLGDRNAVRTPMQWDGDRNAGFSAANPQRLYLPVVIDPEYHVQAVNVASQQQNPNSLLWWMKRLIALRNRYRAFARGSFEMLFTDNRKIFAFLRRYEEQTILVLVNLSRFVQCVELDLGAFRGLVPVELFGSTDFPAIGDLPYFLTLGPHGFYWFSLEHKHAPVEPDLPPPVVPATVEELLTGTATAALNETLIGYLANRRWFRDKSRTIRNVALADAIELPVGPSEPSRSWLTIVEVAFDDGAPERYVVPISYAEGDRAADIRHFHREAIVAELGTRHGGGVVFDATFEPSFGRALVNLVRRRRHLVGADGRLIGQPAPALRRILTGLEPEPSVTTLDPEQSNTSFAVGGRLVVKLMRRLEEGRNPDVEVSQFLTERVRFANAPVFAGHLEYAEDASANSPSATVAVLQEFVANEGTGWSYVLDALSHGLEEAIANPEIAELHAVGLPGLLDPPGHLPASGAGLVGAHLQWAELLGRRTAELHRALASVEDVADFAPEPLTALDRQAMVHAARSLLRRAMRTIRVGHDHRPAVDAVLKREDEILSELQLIRNTPIVADKIRCHGDYHLGQVLWTGKDFVIIDFEGEPARSLMTRRLKRTAVVDVAAMVRSFHYVALAASARLMRDLPSTHEVEEVEPLLRVWYRFVAGTFVRTYREATVGASFVPAERGQFEAMLRFALLEKAIYELGYEANSRPEWVEIPARGLLEMLGPGA